MRPISDWSRYNMLQGYNIPMRRHLTQPLHSGVFHRHRRIEAFGDGGRDHGLALFLEQIN
ncbi:hypothetical protein HMPREF3014_18950 [Pseudomonas sp. HMSC065H01]|nr:hypothetical protein HMPREF3014_18950 [Pseudomonas sp. HMSC065H01]OFR13825.1 hypothetical protein HMPREF2906_08905 [Pseudomonas sp. HMSC065H02]